MIVVNRKNKGVNVYNIWYAEEAYTKPGVHFYHESKKEIGENIVPFRTFLSDLTLPEEEITAKYSKNTRYKIRKIAKEAIEGKVIMAEDVTSEDVEEFVTFFHEFWLTKDRPEMTKDVIYKEIKDYVEAKKFCITKAVYEGQTLVYHTYVQGDDIVRQFHSASLFRLEEKKEGEEPSKVNRNFIGMANCYLHQVDMLTFKEKGIKTFDWGGAGEEEEVASITEFKAAFGGEVAIFYNGQETVGVVANLAEEVLKLLHK